MDKKRKSGYWQELFPLWKNAFNSWIPLPTWGQAMTGLILTILPIVFIFWVGNNPERLVDDVVNQTTKWWISSLWLIVVFFLTFIRANIDLYKKQKDIQDGQQTEIKELKDAESLSIVKLVAEKYFYPKYTTRVVGVEIHNLEKHELTDVYLKLIDLNQTEFDELTGWMKTIQINIDKDNRLFSSENSAVIMADDKEVFKLAEIQEEEIRFLLKRPYKPNRLFPHYQHGIAISHPVWELKFELHGKINGNPFRKEVFTTQIKSTRIISMADSGVNNSVTIDIGEVTHV